jgi:hypothetical protein
MLEIPDSGDIMDITVAAVDAASIQYSATGRIQVISTRTITYHASRISVAMQPIPKITIRYRHILRPHSIHRDAHNKYK